MIVMMRFLLLRFSMIFCNVVEFALSFQSQRAHLSFFANIVPVFQVVSVAMHFAHFQSSMFLWIKIQHYYAHNQTT